VDTEQLIHALATDVEPVTPLRRPTLRATAWVAGAAVYLAVLIAVMSPRDDLGATVQDTWFLIEQGAALLMGITAAAAALASVVPGRRLRVLLLLPLASLTVWLGLIGVRALQDAQTVGLSAVMLQMKWRCVASILAGAALPGCCDGPHAPSWRAADATPHCRPWRVGRGRLGQFRRVPLSSARL
jgi:hypothetical protein